MLWCRQQGLGHAQFPTFGPTIAIVEAADDTVLWKVNEGDVTMFGPTADATITSVGDAVACFFMCSHVGDAMLLADGFKHCHGFATAHYKGRPQLLQVGGQIMQSGALKVPMELTAVGRIQHFVLHDKEGKHWPKQGCLHQRTVICNAQIAFEPD